MRRRIGTAASEFLALAAGNPISLLGSGLATAAAILFAILWAMSALGFRGGGAYLGLIVFVAIPTVFVAGLALIPVGIWRAKRLGASAALLPVIDFNARRTRNIFLAMALASVLNIILLSSATYKGVETMESTEFCGAACHSVMSPEFTAYKRSAHSQVRCVECHVGAGADSFLKSKLQGSWQLAALALNIYERPIPTPVHKMPAASIVCTACHNPGRITGERLKIVPHFKDDQANTPTRTVLLMHTGGGPSGSAHGIHWHADPAVEVRFRSDASRQNIFEVEWKKADGSRDSFQFPKAPADLDKLPWRTMECVDCHNRPAHTFRPAETEVDNALAQGRLDGSLPFLRREAVKVLLADHASQEAAAKSIGDAMRGLYGAKGEKAAAELTAIWSANVFPAMEVKWGTYPNHLGHADEKGCFRCHEGTKIRQDCSMCHALAAMEEPDPKILKDLDVH